MRTVITEKNSGDVSGDSIRGEYVGDDYTVYVTQRHDDDTATVCAYSVAVAVEMLDDDNMGERYFWDEQTLIWNVDSNGNPIDNGNEIYDYGEGSYLFYDSEDAARADAMRHIKAMEDNHEQWLRLDKPVTV
jgi:hypothetical protein